jgi:hypothetical protein
VANKSNVKGPGSGKGLLNVLFHDRRQKGRRERERETETKRDEKERQLAFLTN